MHAFSIPPTQYEIESWLFPHPGVRRLKDARGSAPQRRSVHFVTPLKKATGEKEERTRLKKGHRRWHSHGHQILHDGPRKEEETEGKGEDLWPGNFKTGREWSKPHGHHSKLITEHGEDDTARSKCHSAGSYVVTGSGRTGQERAKSDGNRQSMFEPKHHSSAFRIPPAAEERSSGDGKRHHRRHRSQGHLYSMLAAEARVEREVKGLSRGSGTTRSRHGRSQSQLYESLYSMPFQTVGGKKGSAAGGGSGSGSGSGTGVKPSDMLSTTSFPSQHPRQQPSAPESPTEVSRTTRGARANQQLRKPTSYADRQTAAVLKPHSTDFKALLRSLSCRSLTVEDLSVPFNGAVTQNMSGDHQGSSEGQHPQESPWHQDTAGSDGEEEPGPAFLGSLDYHNFLHGSSKAGVTSSSNTPPRAGTAVTPKNSKLNKIEAAFDDIGGPRTAVNAKSSQESPVSKPARKDSQSLAHKPCSGTLNQTATLRERRCETLAAQAYSPEALRRIPKLGLSVMTDIPVSLTSSTTSVSSSLSTAPLLREGALQSIPSGPLSTISWHGIDPDKLQPFIGPLLPQRPPPNRPLPQLPFPSPVKRRVPTRHLFAKMASEVDSSRQGLVKGDAKTSMEETTVEQRVDQKKGKGLRKKISRFFASDQPTRPADVTACATYQPLSLTTSQDSQRASFSDIFDDVYNAARSSLKSVRGSQNSGHSPLQKPDRASVSARAGNFLPPMSSQHYGAHECTQATTTPPSAPLMTEPPPLIEHPALRSDRVMRDETGLIHDEFVAVPGSGTPPVLPLEIPALSVSRSRPAQIDNITPLAIPRSALSAPRTTNRARLVKEESQATITTDRPPDIDPSPALDRTVDLTWYRTAREEGRSIICSIPRPSGRFEHALTLFVAQYAKGRSFNKYDGKKRFPYFDLPDKIRFEIMRHVIADTHNGKPILLNSKRQAFPAWPDDAFVSLGSVLKPLQAIMWACPRLRADAMVVLLLTRKFHVIFSPFVKERSQPLPTTWLFRYLHLMQDVRLELDMTRLGFGYGWESTAVDSKIHDIGALVRQFTAEMLTRNPANSMGCLTIHCRRYFGYRQGPNTFQGRGDVYKHPLIGGDEDEASSLAFSGQGGSARNDGQPRNHNRRAPSLPPSAAKPYSGHFRHHAHLPHRVPFVTEDQLSVANPLRTLVGRVDSVRMVGFSEQWTYATHLDLWPEAERNSVPDAVKHLHIDRQTPSRHLYAAPSHAVYLDYGIDHGVHRYPPLPDSEPMVCVDYDRENGLFVELGSGKVLSVTENGAEFACCSSEPPSSCRASVPGPGDFTTPAQRRSLTSVPRPSRIPTPSSHGNISPLMQAMRKGTPVKAAAVLGLPGTMITASEAEHLVTPTKRRIIRNASAETEDEVAHPPARNTHLGKLASRSGRSGSAASAFKPGKLSAKRSLHFLGKPG
ncbi:hypothetical protein Daus18300_009918 [Diaporthe australafricana]|uniref:Uncharacterized protein n=1 Tax=Diaporthe australafricana TaxID=127596 RepID=A0ABR3WCH2_9PEZI